MKKAPLFFMFIALFLFGCKPSNPPDNPDKPDNPDNPIVVDMLDVSLQTVNFASGKDASLVVVKTNTNWTATKSADWLALSAFSGNKNTGFLIGASANKGFKRSTTVTIKAGDKTKELKISQVGLTELNFAINGVKFRLLPVEADSAFYLTGTLYGYKSVYLNSFYISETEITNAQWKAVVGTLPYSGENTMPNLPVVANWNAVTTQFIPKINQLSGYRLRLPTECEWEIAAMGGKKTRNYAYAGSINIGDVAWYYANSHILRHDVATKLPNELGLYDMSGNASEWCGDWFVEWSEQNPAPKEAKNPTGPDTGTEKVLKGGDALANQTEYDKNDCRVSSRNHLPPNATVPSEFLGGKADFTGFRLVYVAP